MCRSRGAPDPNQGHRGCAMPIRQLFDNRKSLIFKYFTYKSFKVKDLAEFSS
jgi:hypothetical protein